MWSGAAARSINYGLSQDVGGMLGLRDLYVVAPASSFHHHHHHHHHHDQSVMTDPHSVNSSNPATALGVGVIPLLTATPCLGPANITAENNDTTLMSNRSRSGAIQLWQDQDQSSEHGHYLKKQGTTMFELNDSSGNLVQNDNGLTVSATNSGGATCQDCGNQAKKDCSYRRCRTCCKSRNYDCPTHVKSTWVPESRRRERRLMAVAAVATTAGGGSTGATSGAKKPRLVTSQLQTTNSHTSTSNTTPPRSFDTSSSHQDAGFKESLPGQVRAQAVFKCVRVTAVDDGQDEFAYQATVKICGHVFKGFLYDQGLEGRDVYPNLSELHLSGGGGGGRGGGNGASSSSPMLDLSDVYAASGGGLLGGGGGSTYGVSESLRLISGY